MKHRSLPPHNVQAAPVSVNTMLTWAPARGVGTPGYRTLENELDAKELKVFVLTGNLWRINVEANDCDFHLEITAPDGTATSDRVIVEIPQGTRYRSAREALIQRLTQLGLTLHRQTPLQSPIPIKVMGYGFYDAWHYSSNDPQRGHNHGIPVCW
jgi:hypothetical protein